jgi:hypothetical protein
MDAEYLAAVITFLDRDSQEKTAMTYPITRIELLSSVTSGNPDGLPKRVFAVIGDKWVETTGEPQTERGSR